MRYQSVNLLLLCWYHADDCKYNSDAFTVIIDKTRTHDKKKKLEKIGYMKKLQDLKDKRADNLNRRKNIGDEFKVSL